jgi:hypothetical protein
MILEWIDSLNNWQQAILGIPYAITIAVVILIIVKELKIIRK